MIARSFPIAESCASRTTTDDMAAEANQRINYGVEIDAALFPFHTASLGDVSIDSTCLRFRREKNSHRGLREFRQLKTLLVFCANQECIEEIAALPELETLQLEVTSATDLRPLQCCRSLKRLVVKGATKVPDLEWLSGLPPLEAILFEHFKLVRDLSPITAQGDVRAFGIEGSIWHTQRVESFEPVRTLKKVEAVFLQNCRTAHGGIRPLFDLPGIRYLEIAAFYPDAEFIALEQARPKLKCMWFSEIRRHGSIRAAIKHAGRGLPS